MSPSSMPVSGEIRNRPQVPDDVWSELKKLVGDFHYILKIDGIRLVPFWVSDAVETILGYTPEDCLSTPNWWSRGLYRDDKETAQEAITRLFNKGSLVHTYRFRTKDGVYVHVDDQLRVLMHDRRLSFVVGCWTQRDD